MTSTPSTSPEERQGTRGRILEVALDLFSKHGFTASSMRHIAREVGVRESALYTHFKSKQDILDTLFELYGPGSMSAMWDQLDQHALLTEPCGELKRFLKSAVDLWCSPGERKFMRLGLMESIRAEKLLCNQAQASIEAIKSRLLHFFEQLVQQERVSHKDSELHCQQAPEVDPEFLLIQFMGPLFLMRHELTLFHYSEESCTRLKEFAEKHVEFFFKTKTILMNKNSKNADNRLLRKSRSKDREISG